MTESVFLGIKNLSSLLTPITFASSLGYFLVSSLNLIFIDLRDHTGVLQVVFNPDSEETFKNAQNLRSEYVLELSGIIKKRLEGTINKDMPTGEVELIVDELIIQNISIGLVMKLNVLKILVISVLTHNIYQKILFFYRFIIV